MKAPTRRSGEAWKRLGEAGRAILRDAARAVPALSGASLGRPPDGPDVLVLERRADRP